MNSSVPIFLRAHTETPKTTTGKRKNRLSKPSQAQTTPEPKCWPTYALVFDCETTTDERPSGVGQNRPMKVG